MDDLGRNADLSYTAIFHQDDAYSQQVNDVRTGRQLQSQQGEDVHHFQFSVRRLVWTSGLLTLTNPVKKQETLTLTSS